MQLTLFCTFSISDLFRKAIIPWLSEVRFIVEFPVDVISFFELFLQCFNGLVCSLTWNGIILFHVDSVPMNFLVRLYVASIVEPRPLSYVFWILHTSRERMLMTLKRMRMTKKMTTTTTTMVVKMASKLASSGHSLMALTALVTAFVKWVVSSSCWSILW